MRPKKTFIFPLSGYLVLENIKEVAACAAGKLQKKILFLFEMDLLVFTHFPIKLWQAVLAVLSFTLPRAVNLISEEF